MNVFVGRQAEQESFSAWLREEPLDGRRVRLLIGHSGSGKSALLRHFEQMALDHRPERWFVHLLELNASESVSQFLERVLHETHRLFQGRYLAKGPRDARLLQAMLRAIPSAGPLLAELAQQDSRPGWARFLDYCQAVSQSLEKTDDRLVLLVDPDREMNRDQSEDWLTVAKRLPTRLRVVIAQRPTDALASHPEAKLIFASMPAQGHLSDLEGEHVHHWYRREMTESRLLEAASKWTAAAREELPSFLFEKLGGFAYAHESAIRILAAQRPESPFECIAPITRDVQALVDVQFESLARLGASQLRSALALQTFTVPMKPEIWARAAGIKPEDLTVALSDRRYLAFFNQEQHDRFFPFHPLFSERLERELERHPVSAAEIAESAWRALEPTLTVDDSDRLVADPYDLMAATAIAAKSPEVSRLTKAVALVADAKLRLNMLDSYEADVQLVLRRAEGDALTLATYLNALGGIQERRRQFDLAEETYLQALGIGSVDIQLPERIPVELLGSIRTLRRQAAEACRHLAQLYRKLDRVDEAQELSLRSLAYGGAPATMPDAIRDFGERGLALVQSGDWSGAEMAFRSARAAAKQFGGADYFETSCANLGAVYIRQGRPADARRVLEEGLQSARSRRARSSEATFLYNLGVLVNDGGDPAGARRNWESALAIHIELDEVEQAEHLRARLGGL